MPPRILFLLGGPGSGKGTQALNIVGKYPEISHLSAGDLLREERSDSKSKYGQLIEDHIREGKIVPVEITVDLIKRRMESIDWDNGKFIIDGFPRNFDNFDGWKTVMDGKTDERFCLYLHCPEGVLENRLLKRGESSGRSDDNLDSIRKRFQTFFLETIPTVRRFENVVEIDADRSVDEVWADIDKVISEKFLI